MIRRAKVHFKPRLNAEAKSSKDCLIKLDQPTPSEAGKSDTVDTIKDIEVPESIDKQLDLSENDSNNPNSIEDNSQVSVQSELSSATPIATYSAPPVESSIIASVSTQPSSIIEPPKVEKRRKITINPKESARITLPSLSVKKVAPQKPKICLSSTRVKLPVDKSKVTMFDLLSYNPPMSEEQKERKRKADEEFESASLASSPSKISSPRSSVDSNHSSKSKINQGPRVKVGADGKIVIDEDSLVLHKPKEESTETICESSDRSESVTTYASFRQGECTAKKVRWTNEETIKFYKALRTVGSDFTLISQLFFNGKRSRVDLRNKFKKEEKFNRSLVDKALSNTDFTLLDELLNETSNQQVTQQSVISEAHSPQPVTTSLEEPQEESDFDVQIHGTPASRTRGERGVVTRSRSAALAKATA